MNKTQHFVIFFYIYVLILNFQQFEGLVIILGKVEGEKNTTDNHGVGLESLWNLKIVNFFKF